MVTVKLLNPETAVISERYGLSFFGCVLTIGAIYLFVTFGPNSHEQLKAENIVKHVVAWPVLLYLVRTSVLLGSVLWNRVAVCRRRTDIKLLCCSLCWWKGHIYDSFTSLSVRSVCQVPDLSQDWLLWEALAEHLWVCYGRASQTPFMLVLSLNLLWYLQPCKL